MRRREGPYLNAVRQGFKDLGYIEGRNLLLENRFPNEEPERFRSMAAELASLQPDVLLAAGASASIAAKNATTTIPVVFIVVPDPITSKLVDSLARPTGNVTGLSNFAVQLTANRLEYLKQSIPSLSRVALLINPNVPITAKWLWKDGCQHAFTPERHWKLARSCLMDPTSARFFVGPPFTLIK